MVQQRHIIQSQQFVVEVPNEDSAKAWMNRISQAFRGDFMDRLGKAFDTIVPEDRLIRLDRVAIDLPPLVDEVDVESVIEAIIKQIKKQISSYPNPAEASYASRDLETLIHYFRYGYLPWWVKAAPGQEDLIPNLLQNLAAPQRAFLRQEVRRSRISKERLAWSLSSGILLNWLDLTEEDTHQLQGVLRGMRVILKNFPFQKKARGIEPEVLALLTLWVDGVGEGLRPWEAVFIDSIKSFSAPDTVAIARAARSYWINEESGKPETDPRMWELFKTMPTPGEQLLDRLAELIKNNSKAGSARERTAGPDLKSPENDSEGAALADNRNLPDESQAPQNSEGLDVSDERLYVSLAGIVLLHPFLPQLFSRLNFLDPEGKDFMDLETREKALHLLAWLGWGPAEKYPEFTLSLLKVLVAWPENLPVAPLPAWDDEMLSAGESLLQAVIQHWAALGNTSPDGLRSGFLQREGILSLEDRGWRLRIEQRTLDILLQKLPWGLGVVRLPWMKRLLFVDWA